MTNLKLGTSIALGGIVVASLIAPASAGTCQVQSSSFFQTKTCGSSSRGNGKGLTVFGQKALRAVSTSNIAALSSVGVRGIRSNGSTTANCQAFDTVEDGSADANAAWAVGGECNEAVKFWLQVNY